MKKRLCKRALCFFLAFVLMMGNSMTIHAAKDVDEEENLARNEMSAECATMKYTIIDRADWNVEASSERLGTHEAVFAIDGKTNTMWHTAGKGAENYNMPHDFTVDLGKDSCGVSKIELTGRADSNGLSSFPKQIEVKSSTDGVEYKTIKEITFDRTPNPGIVQEILLETPVDERYVRLTIKKNWFTNDDQSVSFAEINMYSGEKIEDTPTEVVEIQSPDGKLQTNFWITALGTPMYSVTREGEEIVKDSSLGLVLDQSSGGNMTESMQLISQETRTNDTTWEPVTKITTGKIRDYYNETVFHLKDDKNRKVDIIFRNYNEGVAFRYYFPKDENVLKDFEIVSEQSQFAIPTGTIAHAYGSGNQQIPNATPIENLGTSVRYSPIVLEYQSGKTVAAIYEADLYDYGRLKLQHTQGGVLKTNVQWGSNIKAQASFETPWRAICISDQIGELQVNHTLMMNLSDECALEDTSWIKPGGLIREAKLTDNNTIKCIDFAAEHNIPYIMYDSGWYGTENDEAYSPMVPFKGEFPYMKGGSTMRKCDVDIRDHIEYANSKDIGIILYVNRVHLENYDLDEVFKTYQEWGIKGVKFGFVQAGSQKWSKWLEDAIATAAKYHLLVIVHDEVIPSGMERTYPNLVNMEGVLGDEGKPNAENDLKQIFTRSILGPSDHCFSMPVRKYINAAKTDAFNMALSVLYNAPTPSLYWYGDPDGIMDEERPELKFWDDMPTTWDESHHIDSKFGKYYTMARRNGDEWFLGSATAIDRTFIFAPTYLQDGKKYVAEIYTNSPGDEIESNKIQIKKYIVDSSSTIDFDMIAAGGLCVRMAPATQEDIDSVPEYNPIRSTLENLTLKIRATDMTQYTDASVRDSKITRKLEEAEAILSQTNPENDVMKEALDNLSEAFAQLVVKKVLLNAVDRSKIVVATDNERDKPMNLEAAFDGDVTTKWHTTAGANPPFNLTMDLGESKRIRKIEILGRNDHVNGYPLKFEVLTSEDGENYTKVMEVNWSGYQVYFGCKYGFELPAEVNTRYIQLHFTDSYISGSPYKPISIAELYLYETPFGELEDLIKEANQVLRKLSDDSAKEKLQEAIWKSVDYMQTAETIDDLENQIDLLRDAIDSAEENKDADKSDLEALIAYAKSQQGEEDYQYLIPVVKQAFEKALADAETVKAKADATQAEVDAAYDKLLKMVHYLEFTGNSDSLKVLVDAADGLNEKLYTKESWAVLADARTEARKVLDDENALQDEIDAARDALRAAMDALVEITVDTSRLQKLVDSSQKYKDKLDQYTPSTVRIFEGALKNAGDVLAKEDVTQEEIDAAYAALQNAIFGLREIPNKDKLDELLGKVKAMDLSVYSEATASAVRAAYAQAVAVFEDENADETAVKEAVSRLEESLKNLEAKTDGTEDKTNTEKNDKKTDKTASAGTKVKTENNDKKSAQTGDSTNVMVWFVMMFMTGIVFFSKRKSCK